MRFMVNKTTTDEEYTFTLLRHAESVGNAESRHQGQHDYPLTEKGREQAEQLATYWQEQEKKFTGLISSPLLRTKQTAGILAASLDMDIEYDELLMERDNGKLAGLLHEEARKEIPQPDFVPLYQPIASTGESQWELYLRAGQALNNLLKRNPGRYLVVGHGGLYNMLMHAVLGLSPQPNFQGPRFRFANTGFTLLTYQPVSEQWMIHYHNARPHLAGSEG